MNEDVILKVIDGYPRNLTTKEFKMENEDVKADELVKVYMRMRTKREALKDKFKAEDAALEESMGTIKSALMEILKAAGGEGIKTAYGLVTRIVTERFWTADWASMYGFIKEHAIPELLEKRIHQGNYKQWMDEHPNELPAGINVQREYDLRISKPKK
jgi:hypothetical protein